MGWAATPAGAAARTAITFRWDQPGLAAATSLGNPHLTERGSL
jgi:hypothetical protein